MKFAETQQLLVRFGIAPAIEHVLSEYKNDEPRCNAMIADICRFGSIILQEEKRTHKEAQTCK